MKKKPKLFAATTVAEFDFAARLAFITGAAQRKDQRRKLAQAQAAEKQREERRQLRADRRERIRDHIRHVQLSQRLSHEASAGLVAVKQRSAAAAASKPEVALSAEGNGNLSPASGACMYFARKVVQLPETQRPSVWWAHTTLRLLPEASAPSVASPWLVGSCVSVSLGGFANAGAAQASPSQPLPPAPAPAAATAACSQQQQQQQQQASSKGGSRPRASARRVSRGGGLKSKPQKKRHKSRRPLRKRSRHK
ncbi:hypothetical protein Esti_004083 [Eimeria stiedai]